MNISKKDFEQYIQTVTASLADCTKDMALIARNVEGITSDSIEDIANYARAVHENIHYLQKLIKKWKEGY